MKNAIAFPTKPLALALLFTLAAPAFPWGRQGHRLVALVASDHITPAAQANVKYLLGSDSMAEVASFADDYRSEHPETAGWHYVDIPGSEKLYDRARDCPAPPNDPTSKWHDCAVDRIPYFVGELKDPASPKAEKTFALKMLIHLVGDLHQPLHAIGDARGGNSIKVNEFGTTQCGSYGCNLHATWDSGLIDHRRLSEKNYLALLEKDITELKLNDKPDGTPTAWANASHRAAIAAFVPSGTLIDKQYFEDEIPVVDRELEFGGLHLAHLLNGIFLTPPAGVEVPTKRDPNAEVTLKPRTTVQPGESQSDPR